MKYLKKYKLFSINEITKEQERLIRYYGDDFLVDSQEDIEYVKDILIGLEDLDYLVMVNYTPITFLVGKSVDNIDPDVNKSFYKPQIYIKVDNLGSDAFYGNLGERRDEVEYYINRAIEYLKSRNWIIDRGYISSKEIKFGGNVSSDKEKGDRFLNNPTSYQYRFTYDR